MKDYLIELIKRVRKKRKDNLEWNKKRYWKLTASERLHYDSVRKEIESRRSGFLFLTVYVIKLFGFFFAFLLVLKLLFELDKLVFISMLPSILNMIIITFKITLIVDIFILIIEGIINIPCQIKKLDKNYGFKN